MDDGMQPGGERYLIVGLGNPGRAHVFGRHNIGFMAIDRLAARHDIEMKRVQNKAIVGNGRVAGRSVILAKPQTFMNRAAIPSGRWLISTRCRRRTFWRFMMSGTSRSGRFDCARKAARVAITACVRSSSIWATSFHACAWALGWPLGRMEAAAYVLQDFGRDELPAGQRDVVGCRRGDRSASCATASI